MATNTERITALEKWRTAHDSLHAANPLHSHTVSTGTLTIPGSIDPTGATDVTAALTAWLRGLPQGSKVAAPPGARYQTNGHIDVSGRTLTVTGGEYFTTKDRHVVSALQRGLWIAWGGAEFNLYGATLDGGRPPGVYNAVHEFEFGVDYRNGSGTVEGCTIRNWGGDAVYMGYENYLDPLSICHDVTVRRNVIDGIGRMGLALVAGKNILWEQNTLRRVALYAFDVEPDYPIHACDHLTIRDNVVESYGFDNVSPSCGGVPCTPYFFSVTKPSSGTGVISDISITSNRVTGGIGHLQTSIIATSGRIARVIFTGNTALSSKPLIFQNIDGLTVFGNTGTLQVANCTGVTP